MQCFVYRSSKKDGLYVYLADEDGLGKLPEPVQKQLGEAEFAMTLDLSKRTSLGHENISTVRENLGNQGFHIQMPNDIEHLVERAAKDTLQNPN